MTSSPLRHDTWTTFGIGVLGGVLGGLSMLSFGGIFAVALIAIVGGASLRPRPFGAAGVFLGWATAWTVLFAGATSRCDPSSCAEPYLMPWLLATGFLALSGLVLLVAGATGATWLEVADRGWRTLRSRPAIRVAPAIILGLLAGMFASMPFIMSWLNAVAIALWFGWRHRGTRRRGEIVWFALAGAAGFAFGIAT